MRLLICAGGTGGGVYPALAVLQALRNKADPVLWVGGLGGMEADLVQRADIPFTSIPAAGLHGVGLRAMPGNVLQLLRGMQQSRRILKQFQPDVLFFTGGYVGAPLAIAGRNIPSLLYVPDIEPGLALKGLGRFADRIAVTTAETRPYFTRPERIVVTGYPTRRELRVWDREAACQKLGLKTDLPTLLILGGSKGARSINLAVLAILPQLLPQAQVLHITGKLDWETVQKARTEIPADLAERYQAFDYIYDDIGVVFSAASLVVCRAGASTLGELPLFGLPAVLVPYPYAWRYQKVNADFLAGKGAAEVLQDEQLGKKLLGVIQTLLSDPRRLDQMHKNMLALAQPDAAERIGGLLVELAQGSGRKAVA